MFFVSSECPKNQQAHIFWPASNLLMNGREELRVCFSTKKCWNLWWNIIAPEPELLHQGQSLGCRTKHFIGGGENRRKNVEQIFFSARMKDFDWDKGTPALDQCYKTLKPLYYDYSKFRLNVIILFLRVLNEHSCNTLNDSIERLNPGLSNSQNLLWKS